jgi:hypothetical protein
MVDDLIFIAKRDLKLGGDFSSRTHGSQHQNCES